MLSSYCRPSSRPPKLSESHLGQEIDHPMTPTEVQIADPVLEGETPAEVAMLLTSIRDISNEEVKADPPIITALADACLCFPDLNCHDAEPEGHPLKQPTGSTPMFVQQHDRKKTRSISMDSPEIHSVDDEDSPLLQWRNTRGESTSPPLGHSILSTPPPSPRAKSSRRIQLMPRNNRPRAVSCADAKDHLLLDGTRTKSGSNKKLKLILRRKFSWKNYPELEEFLIANREEYLRHSTLNYTMQQKKYNNKLTERMIQLAAETGYAFDEADFSFVTVRDRIRCYYKSYVQSMKKRGVVIGYAARKMGLVTSEELEESAHTSGKIFVPTH
mmetsp:Transcript_1369/g.2331  ORF Transcript_1369/g.2331 Transcript_1369/m.2331 type:complete len:329 (+) Transcript_1369:143-1129(+)